MAGNALLRALLDSPDVGRVIAVTRRPLFFEHPKLANRIVQFERLASQLAGTRCDDAYCAIGTTLKTAGSREAFRAADLEQVLNFARVARTGGATRLVVVSSVGADPGAGNYYLRVKGEMEAALPELGFESVTIMQPGLLLGPRTETRPVEALFRLVMPALNPLLVGGLKRYRAVAVADLAVAMLAAARGGKRGVQRLAYEDIERLAGTARRAGRK